MNNWITAAAVIVVGMATVAGPAAAQSGEASKGQRVFNTQCKSCHTLEKDGAQVTGPNLHGLVGRKAGTSAGYAYSDAFKTMDIVWTKDTVAKLFEIGPNAYTPGTKMPEQTIGSHEDRQALVDWLEKVTR